MSSESSAPRTEWQELAFSEFVQVQRGFDLPKRSRKDGRVPVVGATGPTGTHSEPQVRGPGVTLGRSASIGYATWMPEDFWPLNTTLFVKDFKGNVPRFVYYLFKTIDFTPYNSGSVQPMLNRNYIARMRLRIPDVGTQRDIVEVLEPLDQLAESNERVAASGKELLREVVSERAVSLEMVPLSQVVQLHRETVDPSELDARSVHHFSLPSHDEGWQPELVPPETIKSRKCTIANPCVLLSKLNPHIPRVWPIPDISSFLHPTASTEFLALEPKPEMGIGVLWALLSAERFQAALRSRVTGTTGSHQRVRIDDAMSTPIPNPLDPVLTDLATWATTMVEWIVSLRTQTQTLRSIRDTLLPRLISGQLEVGDTAEQVEDVA